jgi:pyruvate/2-oxoglutarate dehydrogenase complex dihydrolipoamide dehydrogenase (E3) component
MNRQFDVVVIGAGTAGLVTASGSARLGRKVALIDRGPLGGDCLWTGCVPTKALIATAKLIHTAAHADVLGLEPHRFEVSPRRIMESMRLARARVAEHDDPARFRALGVDVIEGSARLVSAAEVEVGGERIAAKDIVIATGSRTAVPPIDGLAETGFLDHASFLAQDGFPSSVVILGGGAIGIEFAQMFRRFGSRVTVVEMMDEILAHEDVAVVRFVRDLLAGEGIDIRSGWTAKSAHRDGGRKVLSIEAKDGRKEQLVADEIFVASGRRGNTEGLGLEALGTKMNRSYIAVNDYLQTSVPRVWACGDVHGGLQFTHVAAYEAVNLVRNMLFPGRRRIDYSNVPWALYTDPEAAHLGLTEEEAVERFGGSVTTHVAQLEDVDRAIVERAARGFVKIIAGRRGRILGAHVVASNASSLIEPIVLARARGVRVGQLAQLVSPYPSLADAVQKAASQYYETLGTSRVGGVAKRIAAWSQ